MKNTFSNISKFGFVVVALMLFVTAADIFAQTRRKRRAARPAVVTTPQPRTEPLIISRAEDFPDENATPTLPAPIIPGTTRVADDPNAASIDELRARLALLESNKGKTSDQKQKSLLLYLDILTKAEQRSESLRKQTFDMIEKESTVRARLDAIETDVRPESIEKNVAMAGTLRPEELRDSRRRSLTAERTNLQNLLAEITRTRASLESNLLRADALVDRMRSRLEKDIDDALTDDTEKKP